MGWGGGGATLDSGQARPFGGVALERGPGAPAGRAQVPRWAELPRVAGQKGGGRGA